MKSSTIILRRGAVLTAAAATLVTVAAGASSAGTRAAAPVTAQPRTATAVQAGLAALVLPDQINQFCAYTNAEPLIGYGSTGVAVQQAQCELDSVDNGPIDLPSDGIFGPETKAWTEQFQACAGITQDGIIGPVTWHYLDEWSAVARSCG